MRDFCFSAGRTSTSGRTGSSRSIRSNASQSLLQRKRTLDEFPMEHSLQDTHRLFQERRDSQAKQRLNLISTNGESNKLSSYSRRRFETALTIKGEEPLPPPSPEERTLFWEGAKPSWAHRRHLSLSAKPVTKPIELSPRPGSGPPVGVTVAEGVGGRGGGGVRSAGGRPAFNHLRGNNSAYPTIRKLLQESNAEYRVVCPSSDCHYDKCRRPSVDCSSKSDFILVPLEDEAEEQEEVKEEPVVEEYDEERIQEEMMLMSNMEDVEHIESAKIPSDRESPSEEIHKKSKKSYRKETAIHEPAPKEADEEKKDDDEDNPASPWHCWVDDATVSSIGSHKSDSEAQTAEVAPSPTPAPEVIDERPSTMTQQQDGPRLTIPSMSKAGSKQSLAPKRASPGTPKKRKGRLSQPDPIVAELPPPPPPPVVEEVVEEVEEEEQPPEPVLPSYICPSSTIKSTQAEIKLWLHKSTFSAANRLLPIY